jgi:hypothetical protein
LLKHERVRGKLRDPEEIAVAFRERPFSVRMDWRKGATRAARTLFVDGEDGNQLLVLGAGWRRIAGVVQRDPHGKDALDEARYPITEFGIKIGTLHALKAWEVARNRGDLEVVYHGTRRVKELDGRVCWVLKRKAKEPEDDGIIRSTFFFDKENWLLVGSILDGEDSLIASYYFRDLQLNPDFPTDTFTREGLKKKR